MDISIDRPLDIYLSAKQGDNALGSVRPSVHPLPLSRLNPLAYDLDIRYVSRP